MVLENILIIKIVSAGKIADQLVEECTENIEEVKIVESKNKCSSCMLYIVLFSVLITINVGIATHFVYYKYMNRNKKNIPGYDYVYHPKNVNINGRIQRNIDQKSNLLFLQRHD